MPSDEQAASVPGEELTHADSIVHDGLFSASRAFRQTAASSEWIEPLGPLRRAMSLALLLDFARAQRAAGTSQLFTRTTVRIHGWMQHS